MKHTTLALSVGILLSACGGSSSVDNAPSQNIPAVGAAQAQPSLVQPDTAVPVESTTVADTSSLVVASDFDFSTARTVDVDFDLEQARGQAASVSICTDFDPQGDVFDVNYDSCTVRGPMLNGVFQHSMEVTNDISSVAGVVWFQDQSIEPMMQVFPVVAGSTQSSKDRSVLSNSGNRSIVWR